MIPKELRLTKKRDFDRLMKEGRWFKTEHLTVKYLNIFKTAGQTTPEKDLDNGQNMLKIAVSVGLKISKSAVVRNRMRRQIFSVIERLLKEKRLKTNLMMLISMNKLGTTALSKKENNKMLKNTINFADLSEETQSLLKKIHALV